MKKFILLILLIACLVSVQNMTGKWHGILNVQGMEMRLTVHTSKEASTYRAQIDSPGEKAFGMTASAANFKNSTFNIVIANLDFRLMLKEIAGWVLKQTN